MEEKKKRKIENHLMQRNSTKSNQQNGIVFSIPNTQSGDQLGGSQIKDIKHQMRVDSNRPA